MGTSRTCGTLQATLKEVIKMSEHKKKVNCRNELISIINKKDGT